MVDLPPSVEELNEYAKYAFLNEMHTMASQITTYVKNDQELVNYVKIATELIEMERKEMKNLFKEFYERPVNKQAVALILRCAELYLASGVWFLLCHGDVRLFETGQDQEVDRIRNCFSDPLLTERYLISSPIIELTLTRIEMMQYFQNKQKEMYKGPDPNHKVNNSAYAVPLDDTVSRIDLFNYSTIPFDAKDPDDLILSDFDYLETRESYIWAVLRELRFWSSLFTILYFSVFSAISMNQLIQSNRSKPLAPSIATGYGFAMLICEIISFRVCHVSCFRPTNEVKCLYPGLDLYAVQFFSSVVSGFLLVVSVFIDKEVTNYVFKMMIYHHMVSVIWPFITESFYFKWHQRVEREFKWVRIGFYLSVWWDIYKFFIYLFFTPAANGIITFFYSSIANRPRTKEIREQKVLIA